MDCNHARELFSEYIDGFLPDDTSTSLKEHISSCPSCRHEFDLLCKIVEETKGLRDVVACEDFLVKVRYRIDAGQSNARSNKKIFSPSVFAVTFCVVALVLFVFFHNGMMPLNLARLHKNDYQQYVYRMPEDSNVLPKDRLQGNVMDASARIETVKASIVEAGGKIVASGFNARDCAVYSFKVNIPGDKYEKFIDAIGSKGFIDRFKIISDQTQAKVILIELDKASQDNIE